MRPLLPLSTSENGAHGDAGGQCHIVMVIFFAIAITCWLTPLPVDKTFYHCVIFINLIIIAQICDFIALKKLKRRFYLAVALVSSTTWRIRNRAGDGENRKKSPCGEFFQQLGKTFMLPVALLSFCGIMLGISSSLSSRCFLTPCCRGWITRCCRPSLCG